MIKVLGTSFLVLICIGMVLATNSDLEKTSWISLHSYAFDTKGPEPVVPAQLKANLNDGYSTGYFLVKFPGPITVQNLDSLKAQADKVYVYIPYFSYLAKINKSKLSSMKTLTGASWIGSYHPAYKIAQDIASISELDKKDKYIITIRVFPDEKLETVLEKLRVLGVTKVEGTAEKTTFSRIRILLTPKEVVSLREKIALIREVFWIDREPHMGLMNDTTIWVGQSGVSGGQTTPVFDHGIYGVGTTVAVLDTGIDADMCFFYDNVKGTLPPHNDCNSGTTVDNTQRKVIAVDFLWSTECAGGISNTEWDTQGHGTHVAGIITGDNFAHLLTHDTADGMAPGAKIVFQDGGYQTDTCADLPGIGCPVVDLNPIFQQVYTQGARIHSNSWGDNEDATPQYYYTAASEDVDQFMYNNKDFLVFFAAGNSGQGAGTVGSPGTAKSCVSVGATNRGASAETLASFTSCGQTDDGRWKPEITIPGVGIISAGNDGNVGTFNCGTASMSGTSMACPAAAGLTALIRQYYTDGWYPTGVKTPANALTPSAALMKASLVNSAQAMTGVASPIPSNCQAWGRILLDNVMYWQGETRRLYATDDTGFTSSGQTRVYNFNVLSNTVPFKATLAWTDYQSTPAVTPHINNDLDLTITAPGGATYHGNVFASGQSTTGGTADRLNTLEQALFLTPTTGTYTVTISAYNIPNGPQPFALVVTGSLPIAGVHAQYQPNSAVYAGNPTGGDGDAYADNCETATVNFIAENVGDTVANNATATITSANGFITITTPMPINLGNIAVGGSVNSSFTYTTGAGATKATCKQLGTFNISTTATGQSAADTNSFSFTHEADVSTGTQTWPFEPASGMEGWTVSSGTWALSSARVNTGGSTRSAHSSQNLASQCDIMTSPTIQLAPALTSTLTLADWFATEQSTPWYDRCHVHIIDVDNGNTRTLISPTSGKLYKTGTFYNDSLCSVAAEAGWAGNATADMTWGNSVFNLGTTYAGHNVKFEIKYYTDTVTQWEGVYVDDITLTNARVVGCDAQSDTCTGGSPPGKVLNTLRITKSSGNPALSWTAVTGSCTVTGYGIYRGTLPWTTFNHASLSCATSGTTYTDSAATLSYYYLVVPYNASNEGSYGTQSSGTERPQGTSPCKTQSLTVCN